MPSDGLGRPFALIEFPTTRQWAVVLRVVPEGGALVDPDTRDQRVAEWGQLLATAGQLGRGAALVAATVETLPDDGALLAAHVAGLIRPDAPDFARQVLTAAAVELPTGVSSTVGHVAVTFTEKSLGIEHAADREVRAEAVAAEFGRMLPDLSAAADLRRRQHRRAAGRLGADPPDQGGLRPGRHRRARRAGRGRRAGPDRLGGLRSARGRGPVAGVRARLGRLGGVRGHPDDAWQHHRHGAGGPRRSDPPCPPQTAHLALPAGAGRPSRGGG